MHYSSTFPSLWIFWPEKFCFPIAWEKCDFSFQIADLCFSSENHRCIFVTNSTFVLNLLKLFPFHMFCNHLISWGPISMHCRDFTVSLRGNSVDLVSLNCYINILCSMFWSRIRGIRLPMKSMKIEPPQNFMTQHLYLISLLMTNRFI